MIGELIAFVHYLPGYYITFADAYAKSGHRKNSLHYIRLAVDFNLFIDGKYKKDWESYYPLGLFWEKIGGSWGGRFKNKDANHFSLAHGGRK